jgi:hypothetical protein
MKSELLPPKYTFFTQNFFLNFFSIFLGCPHLLFYSSLLEPKMKYSYCLIISGQ